MKNKLLVSEKNNQYSGQDERDKPKSVMLLLIGLVFW